MNKKIKKLLTEVAENSEPVSKMRVAAAVVYKNRVVSIGRNQYKTHPIMLQFRKNEEAIFLHAEVDAINKASKLLDETQFKKATLYILRLRRNGTCGIAKPCSGCQQCIDSYAIKNVIYTD